MYNTVKDVMFKDDCDYVFKIVLLDLDNKYIGYFKYLEIINEIGAIRFLIFVCVY